MTILEQFVSFANSLPAEQIVGVEDALAEIMESYSARFDFTETEYGILDQRLAETSPSYSHLDTISELFGKPFAA
jgi:hypothetical protein